MGEARRSVSASYSCLFLPLTLITELRSPFEVCLLWYALFLTGFIDTPSSERSTRHHGKSTFLVARSTTTMYAPPTPYRVDIG